MQGSRPSHAAIASSSMSLSLSDAMRRDDGEEKHMLDGVRDQSDLPPDQPGHG